MTSKINSNQTIELTASVVRQNDIFKNGIADSYECDNSYESDCNEDANDYFGSFYEKNPPIVDCFGARDFEN